MTMSAEGVLGIIQDVFSNDPDKVAIEFQIIKKGKGHRTMINEIEELEERKQVKVTVEEAYD